jgi:hypothetical protein
MTVVQIDDAGVLARLLLAHFGRLLFYCACCSIVFHCATTLLPLCGIDGFGLVEDIALFLEQLGAGVGLSFG